MREYYQKFQVALDGWGYTVGDCIPYDPNNTERHLIVGSGDGGENYLLASIGVDRYGRIWRQDHSGLTMIADFSALLKAAA